MSHRAALAALVLSLGCSADKSPSPESATLAAPVESICSKLQECAESAVFKAEDLRRTTFEKPQIELRGSKRITYLEDELGQAYTITRDIEALTSDDVYTTTLRGGNLLVCPEADTSITTIAKAIPAKYKDRTRVRRADQHGWFIVEMAQITKSVEREDIAVAIDGAVSTSTTGVRQATALEAPLFSASQGSLPDFRACQTTLRRTGLVAASALVASSTPATSKIAVIDVGFDRDESEWRDAVKTLHFVDHTSSGGDHGDRVVSVLASRRDDQGMDGVLADSELHLIAAKTSLELIQALYLATEVFHAQVVVLSEGTSFDPCLKQQLEKAEETLHVVAAGNCGSDLRKHTPQGAYPAKWKLPNLLVVAGTNAQDQLWTTGRGGGTKDRCYPDIASPVSAYGTNFGSSVEVAAPSTRVLVQSPKHGFRCENGTSFSAPQVGGLAGLLVSTYLKGNERQWCKPAVEMVKKRILSRGKSLTSTTPEWKGVIIDPTASLRDWPPDPSTLPSECRPR